MVPFEGFLKIESENFILICLEKVLLKESSHEKTCFFKGKNKTANQLCINSTADQCLCFLYIDSTIPLLLKYEMLSL